MTKFSDETERAIIARYLAGESTVVLGRVYETSRHRINRVLTRHNVERRKPEEQPMRSNAKLRQIDPGILRQMVEEGMSIRAMGQALGVASSTVHETCVTLGIQLNARKRRRPISESLFIAPLNARESWLLGLLMTDGTVSNEMGHVKLSITDKDGVDHASQIVGFGNIRECSPRTSEYNGQTIQGKLSQWRYVACSQELVERLEGFGVTPRKTKTLAFPNVADVALPDLLRGLWDGDGSWYIDKRDNALCASFGCASEAFMRALQPITARITGSSAQVRASRRGDFWQLSYYGQFAITLARWVYYEEGVVCLERKQSVVQPFL